jgi:hypothetical protein
VTTAHFQLRSGAGLQPLSCLVGMKTGASSRNRLNLEHENFYVMKTLVVYHRSDFDGIFCCEIARRFLEVHKPSSLREVTYVGWDFGTPRVSTDGHDELFVLDLPPDCLEFKDISEVKDRLVWIDHHKSSIEKWPKDLPGFRIDGVAACRLAWQWFTSTPADTLPLKEDFVSRRVSEPVSVRLAGEYDIWDKRDPNADLFQHGLRSCSLTGLWKDLLDPRWGDELVQALLDSGKAVQYSKQHEDASVIKAFGYTAQFEGLCCLVCNHARFNSHLFAAAIRPEHDALVGFNWTGKVWRVSMYHAPGKEHIDLSVIAVKYGGGGHRGACGFTSPMLLVPLT